MHGAQPHDFDLSCRGLLVGLRAMCHHLWGASLEWYADLVGDGCSAPADCTELGLQDAEFAK
ncbi:hypothetical protein, partial [Streptomyces sp. NRRL S-1896]|uniref:hypothetical protein n=1 Tax=Streptomyces sp. NRRL S-1896 TaxID=1463893 RepID=UPI00055BC1E2